MATEPVTTIPVAQSIWEKATYTVAKHLREQYPSLGDRLESAIVLVRDSHVTLDDDGIGHVASRTQPGTTWRVNGVCTCPDAEQAPNGRCAHRIAVALYKQVCKDLPPTETTHTPIPEPDDQPPPPSPLAAVPDTEPATAENQGLPRSIRDIIADLSRPLPAACVASKTLKGNKIQYLHWQTVARVLDAYAPGWHGTVQRMDTIGNACVITYRLAIPCAEGLVIREATGQEDEEVGGYGDPSSNAEAMAFKRAAAKFGVGLWLYTNDNTDQALTAWLKQCSSREE